MGCGGPRRRPGLIPTIAGLGSKTHLGGIASFPGFNSPFGLR